MSSKQDRQGVRTPAHVEQKYGLGDLGKNFSEIMGIAQEARKTAQDALFESEKKLTSEEVFNLLTNNGANQGIFRGEDGEIYINASFLATGIISSADGTVKLDLNNNCVTIDGTRKGYMGGHETDFKTQLVLSSSGINGYGENEEGMMEHTLDLGIGVGGSPTTVFNPAWYMNTGMIVTPASGVLTIGTSAVGVNIFGGNIDIGTIPLDDGSYVGSVTIQGKTVYWEENSDGTYTLKADS
jgi:hypothetical protein